MTSGRKAVLALAAVALSGCAQGMLSGAEKHCTKQGLEVESTPWFDCVAQNYAERKANMARAAMIMGSALQGAAQPTYIPPPVPAMTPAPPLRFYKFDYVDGLNRTCVYDTTQGSVSQTIPAINFCPLH